MARSVEPTPPSRRQVLSTALAVAGVTLGTSERSWATADGIPAGNPKPLHLLLHSGWQEISLADLAQTAGGLAFLERHFPDARITLWPLHLDDENELMLRRRFETLRIVRGEVDPKTLKPTTAAVQKALDDCDVLVHNSAPFVVSPLPLEAAREARKPFGLLGVGLADVDDRLNALLSNAAFVLTSDATSLESAKRTRVASPVLEMCPDLTFACDVRDDTAADAFCDDNGLKAKRFLCCVPRLRYTPFAKRFAANEVNARSAINDRFAEEDHAKLRHVIVEWVRRTNQKVLVCPQMRYQLQIIDKLVIDPLPADVKKNVVKRSTFWLPSEAASTFARASTVVSYELHSVLLAIAAGTPAVHVRLPTENHTAQMLRDVGLSEWVLEMEDLPAEVIAATVLEMQNEPKATTDRINSAMRKVATSYRHAAKVLSGAGDARP